MIALAGETPPPAFNGILTDFTVVPANIDERDSFWEITSQAKNLLLGDKGYIRPTLPTLKEELEQHGINLQIP